MRVISLFLTFVCLAIEILGAETVSVQLIALSPRVFSATARERLTSLEYTLHVSAFPRENGINNELAPASQDHGYTHEGFFILEDPTAFEPAIFPFVLDIPEPRDENQNGVYDFFDPQAAVVNQRTAGRHPAFDGGGTDFSATWNRSTGEAQGTVVLDLPYFGLRFSHVFQLGEFTGRFSFERLGTNLNGAVALTNVFDLVDTISGPFSARVRSDSTLEFSAGSWEAPGGLSYKFAPLGMFDAVGTHFISLVTFEDGNLGTSEADYLDWFFLLSSADENGNGVLDLVEGGAPPATPPSLEVANTTNGIQVTLRGMPGKSYSLEATDLLGTAAQWRPMQTIALAAPAQSVTLLAGGASGFFRLREL